MSETPEEVIEIPEDVTPEDEAGDFETPDEKRLRMQNDHELNVIAAKKGWIGKFTGSTNEANNNGIFILLISLFLLALFGLADIVKNGAISQITDNFFKLVSAIVGYVIGTNTTRE